MNLVEGLSRQIERVAQMKSDAEEMVNTPGVNMTFYIAGCKDALENGHQALGTGEIIPMKAAYEALAGIN